MSGTEKQLNWSQHWMIENSIICDICNCVDLAELDSPLCPSYAGFSEGVGCQGASRGFLILCHMVLVEIKVVILTYATDVWSLIDFVLVGNWSLLILEGEVLAAELAEETT